MHEKSVQALEFPKVLAKVAQEAGFSIGRERVLALRPTTDPADAARRLAFTSEAVRLLEEQPRAAVGGAHDIRAHVRRASRGGDLGAHDLVAVGATLRGARTVAGLLEGLDPALMPQLCELRSRLPVHPALIRRIEETFDDDGQVLDTASALLRRLRGDVRTAHQLLQQRMRSLVGELGQVLQEPIVTTRGDRYVLPVKADFRGRVRGVVHDQSASGATLFIEPMAALELNNRLRSLQSQEQEEIERILREISDEIGREADAIDAAVEALAEFDLQLAKARYARSTRSTAPRLNDLARILLRRARHPLLGGTVVPIDFRLGEDFTMVVITGPNTGGKTVALKTVGLLSLMAQAGLHVPADDGSELAVLEEVFADIGDEQSIEQSLSTFSSHMTRIIEILRGVEAVRRRGASAGERPPPVLVLLDELGAGTDPSEGSALARSILTYLLDRRVATVATTHYSELKAFAHAAAGAVNASVAFDIETLSPTYELEIGVPGRSNALAIAERLGLDPRIVRGARRHVGSAAVRMEDLLEDLERERDAASDERERAVAERAEAELGRRRLEEERARLEEERVAVLDAARAEARRQLDDLVAELARIRAQARPEDLTRERLHSLRDQARRLEDRVPAPARPRRRRIAGDEAGSDVVGGPPQVGDTVRVLSFDQTGELLTLSAGGAEAEVQMGPMRVRVPIDEVERVRAREAGPPPPVVVLRPDQQRPAPQQLDMRGWRVEDALEELETYLNDATLSGMTSVRILHGKGTGALRSAVRQHLLRHPLVQSSGPAPPQEGGDGVTIVRLSA